MTFAAPNAEMPPPAIVADNYRAANPERLIAQQKPGESRHPRFLYRRRLLAIDAGKVLLRLRSDPVIELNPATMECEVLEWGVRMPHSDVGEINRVLARRFLDLFSKADAQRLTDEEQRDWIKVLDQVDYAAFCADRAAPRYVEGMVLQKASKVRVEWHDGEKEFLTGSPATALQVLNQGDRFGAFVKWGRSGAAQSVERVTLLAHE